MIKVLSYKILGPDYVTGLREFNKQHSQIKKFGLHVVRLPTKMDMFTCYADLASQEAILARYHATTLENALRKAAHAGNAADIHYLIKLGADVNARDTEQNQRCALHWAIYHKRTPAIVALLMHNADRTVRDSAQSAPIPILSADCVWLIIENNGDVDIEAITQAKSTNLFVNLSAINKPSIANVFTTSAAATECLRKIYASNLYSTRYRFRDFGRRYFSLWGFLKDR